VADIDRKGLIEMMLGRTFVDMYPEPPRAVSAAALTVENLSVPGWVGDFSMSVPRGKILCIAGQVGSGAVEVISALAGLVHEASGKVTVDGKPLRLGSAADALRRNVMFVSGDRAEEGVFRNLSVLDNLVATRLDRHAVLGLISRRGLKSAALALAEKVGVDRRRLHALAGELSGGNQQKLAFGRCIDRDVAAKGGVLVMNEPTRGIDVGARAEIYRIMREFCEQGFALVMTSSDLEEIVGLGDVVVTMYRGRQVGTYAREDASMARIVSDITHPAEQAA